MLIDERPQLRSRGAKVYIISHGLAQVIGPHLAQVGLDASLKHCMQPAVLDGVRRYSHEDNDVAAFGCILRNEVDEEFRFVQKQLKDTVVDLLRVHLKAKHTLKGDDIINMMAEEIEEGMITLEQWNDIVQYMYNEDDSMSLGVMLAGVTLRCLPSRLRNIFSTRFDL